MIVYRIEQPDYLTGPYVQYTILDKFGVPLNDYDEPSITDVSHPQFAHALYLADFGGHLGRTHSDDEHPGAQYDMGDFCSDYHVCGFKSMEQYYKWFRGYHALLGNLGYRMSIYSVSEDDVVFGSYQVGFNRSAATLIATRKLGVPYGQRY